MNVTTATSLPGELITGRRRSLPRLLVAYAPDIASISILIGLLAVVSWDRLWRTATFADADVTTLFIPYYAFLGEHIRHLDVPGWIPNTLGGMPFAADPESGWGYLPAMISFAIFPPLLAYKALVIVQLLLTGISTYIFARLIGFAALGSFAAAAAWTFGPSTGVAGCCTVLSEFNAWIPAALVGVELTCRAQGWSSRLCASVFTGLAISQILAGWLGQGMYYGLLIVASYFVFRAVAAPPREGQAFRDRVFNLTLNGTLSFAFGFAFGAASLWPRLVHVPLTFLGSDEYRSTTACEPDCGRSWYVLVKILVSQMGYWYPYYLGGAVLACATIGLIELSRRRELFYFAGLAIVIFLLAMRTASIHSLFYALPEFEGLHKHATLRIVYLLPFPVAMLVGAAVDGFHRIVRHRWALGLPILARFVWWFAVLAVPVASLEVAPFTRRAYLTTWLVIFAGVLLARTWTRQRLPWLVRAEKALPVALILLVLWDPTVRSVIENPKNSIRSGQAREVVEVINSPTDPGGAGEFLQSKQAAGERFRYFGYVAPPNVHWQAHEHFNEPDVASLLLGNRAIPLGLEDFQGYNPGQIERYLRFFEAFNHRRLNYHEDMVFSSGLFSPLIDLLNVRYIVVPSTSNTGQVRQDLVHFDARYNQVFMNDEVLVLENPNALPRAWMVHEIAQVPADTALKRLEQGRVDPRQTALVEDEPPAVEPLPAGAQDQVNITGYDDDSITLTAEAAADGFLVLSEVYNPGWSVKVDGKPAQLYETDYLLRGVAVPEGTHEIVFTYQLKSIKYGIYVSLATAGIAAIVVFWGCLTWFERRRRAKRGYRQ